MLRYPNIQKNQYIKLVDEMTTAHMKIVQTAFGPGPKLEILLANSLGRFWQTPLENVAEAHSPVNCPSTQKFTLPEVA